MRRYLIKIILFFVLVAAVDCGFGKIGDYLRDHAKGGMASKVKYICEQCDEDIVMMGSSRMQHHYIPQVFEDSLGMTCFNAGIDGNGILLSYGFLKMILERYTPKMIIYDVSGFDLYCDDNTKYLDLMKPYYNKEYNNVSGVFKDVDKKEQWKMYSNLYRYNSKLFQLVGDNIHPTSNMGNGYEPMYRTMNYDPSPPKDSSKKHNTDSLKISYFVKFINLAREKNVDVYLVTSPTYFGELISKENSPMDKLVNDMNLNFTNNYYDSLICSSKEYWSDGTHMNNKGAQLFSEKIAGDIASARKQLE